VTALRLTLGLVRDVMQLLAAMSLEMSRFRKLGSLDRRNYACASI
jgi:hypothetical protein